MRLDQIQPGQVFERHMEKQDHSSLSTYWVPAGYCVQIVKRNDSLTGAYPKGPGFDVIYLTEGKPGWVQAGAFTDGCTFRLHR